MESPRPPRPTDPLGSSSFNPAPLSGERFSVQDVERQVRSNSRRREHTTSRSRREQRAEISGPDRYIWFGVALVAGVYLAFLGWHVIKPGGAPAPSPAPEKPVAAATVADPAPEIASATVPEASPVESVSAPEPDLLKLEETVATLKRARLLHEEAVRLVREKRLGTAEEKFAEAAGLMPGNFALLLDWSNTLREQNRWGAARDQLLKAVAIDPSSVPARVALAQCCFQLRQFPDALAMAKWVLETETYSEAAHQIAADVYFGMEQHTDAIRHLQKLVALNSNNRIAANNLGAAYLRLGQNVQAIRTFENVIRDEPGNSQAYYYLALAFLQKNEPELSVDVLIRASGQFGREYVLAWTRGPEFQPLASLESFAAQFNPPVVPVLVTPDPPVAPVAP
jgi:tetratricopeptide (TPR) repeat protein